MRLVPSRSPYDAGRLLWYLGLHAVPGLESYRGAAGSAGPRYARVLRLTGGPGVVRLSLAAGGGYDAELGLTDPADESEALGQLTHLLDLDGDPAPAEAALSADPLLGPLVASRPGLRPPGSADHVETLLCTIIGQQISLAGARTVTGRVVAALGAPLPDPLPRDGLTHAFPAPDALAGGDPESLPMPRSRGRGLVVVAAAAAAWTPHRSLALIHLWFDLLESRGGK